MLKSNLIIVPSALSARAESVLADAGLLVELTAHSELRGLIVTEPGSASPAIALADAGFSSKDYWLGWLDIQTGLFNVEGGLSPEPFDMEIETRIGLRVSNELCDRLRAAESLSEAARDLLDGDIEVGEEGELAFIIVGNLLNKAEFERKNRAIIELAEAASNLGRPEDYLAIYVIEITAAEREGVEAQAQAEQDGAVPRFDLGFGEAAAPAGPGSPCLAFSMKGAKHEGWMNIGPQLGFLFQLPPVDGATSYGTLDINGLQLVRDDE